VTDRAQPTSIEALYAEHHGWLRGWLRRRLGNGHDAADLAHDTFIRLLARDQPVAVREPRALLATIAKGVVSNFNRRLAIERAYLETLAQLPEPQAPGPETRALVLETLVEIDRRLSALKPDARRAFLMFQVEGMKQAEIAAALGISLATVQRHLVRAIHQCVFGP